MNGLLQLGYGCSPRNRIILRHGLFGLLLLLLPLFPLLSLSSPSSPFSPSSCPPYLFPLLLSLLPFLLLLLDPFFSKELAFFLYLLLLVSYLLPHLLHLDLRSSDVMEICTITVTEFVEEMLTVVPNSTLRDGRLLTGSRSSRDGRGRRGRMRSLAVSKASIEVGEDRLSILLGILLGNLGRIGNGDGGLVYRAVELCGRLWTSIPRGRIPTRTLITSKATIMTAQIRPTKGTLVWLTINNGTHGRSHINSSTRVLRRSRNKGGRMMRLRRGRSRQILGAYPLMTPCIKAG